MTTDQFQPIDTEAAARAVYEAKLLENLGMAPTAGTFTFGCNATEYRDSAIKRVPIESMPLTIDGITAAVDRIHAEDRKDLVVKGSSLRMANDGTLVYPGCIGGLGPLTIEGRGLTTLLFVLRPLFPSAAAYMQRTPVEARAIGFNANITHYADDLGDREVRLRTRIGSLGWDRSVFAAVTGSYSVLDGDTILGYLQDQLPEGARGYVSYDPWTTRTTAEAFWGDDRVVAEGETFRFGVRVTTRDDALGSVYARAIVHRVESNATQIVQRKDGLDLYRRVHKGDISKLSTGLKNAIDRVADVAKEFCTMWAAIKDVPISDVSLFGKKGFETVQEAIEHVISKDKIPGFDKSEAALAAAQVGHQEPTAAGLCAALQGLAKMAVTHADQEAIEEIAGQLTFDAWMALGKEE